MSSLCLLPFHAPPPRAADHSRTMVNPGACPQSTVPSIFRSGSTELSVGRTPADSRSVHPRLARETRSRRDAVGPRRSLPHRNCGNGRCPVATMPSKSELPGHVAQTVATDACANDASTQSITSFRLRFATATHFIRQDSRRSGGNRLVTIHLAENLELAAGERPQGMHSPCWWECQGVKESRHESRQP